MVTTVMVAVILPAAVQAITSLNALARSSSDRAIALSLAESKLAEIIVEESWVSGQVEGNFEDIRGMDKYSWSLISTDMSSVTKLEMKVKWLERGEEKYLTLTTMKGLSDGL